MERCCLLQCQVILKRNLTKWSHGTLLRLAPHSKRGPESFFYIQSEDILTKRGQNFSPRFVTIGALSSLFHNMGVGGYEHYPLFVRARHVQRCVKKCPHFECVIHRYVLALNAGTNTLYTCVYIVSSLWMLGQVGGVLQCQVILKRNLTKWIHGTLLIASVPGHIKEEFGKMITRNITVCFSMAGFG